MNRQDEFYTVRGYELLEKDRAILTPSMEDYLEMIYRLSKEKGYTRISDVASALNVQPPSVTNMIKKLAQTPYLKYEKYGIIQLNNQGRELGAYLLRRHEIIAEFLHLIGVKDNLLEETEKIEHNISNQTLQRIELLINWLKESSAGLMDPKETDDK